MKILLIGDIFSMAGREMIDKHLENIKNTKGINFIIANGENIAHGNGITNNYYKFLLEHHINVVTLGNHSFANHDIFNFIDDVILLPTVVFANIVTVLPAPAFFAKTLPFESTTAYLLLLLDHNNFVVVASYGKIIGDNFICFPTLIL